MTHQIRLTFKMQTNLHETIDAWNAIQSDQVSLQASVIDSMLSLKKTAASRNTYSGLNYNPLKMLGIGETTHSRILGDLLNEDGSHGQGKLFLNRFLKKVGVSHSEYDTWGVLVERGNIDICLRRTTPPGVVVIENKSNWAVDQDSQLYRYWYRSIYTHPARKDSDRDNFKVVYMTPDEKKKPQSNSLTKPNDGKVPADAPERMDMDHVPFTFNGDLQTWLSGCISQIPSTNTRLINFLQLYRELWT